MTARPVRSDTPKDDGHKEPQGGGAGNAPKEKAPAKGYGMSARKKGPGRSNTGKGKSGGGKGGKH